MWNIATDNVTRNSGNENGLAALVAKLKKRLSEICAMEYREHLCIDKV